MSNHLAIATVTAALRQRLHDSVTQDVSGTSTEIFPLNDSRLRDTQPTLNLFLYHVAPTSAWSNEELPVRRSNGSVATRPTLALRLYYMLTAFGRASQTDAEAHRVLGSAMRTLHERPILTRSEITAVVQANASLAGSDLADQVDLVRLTPQNLSLEEMSKVWSTFFQTPYRISVTYEASVVLIDGTSNPQPSLPVRIRNLYVVTLRTPTLDRVEAAGGASDPIVPEADVLIRGINLRGEPTRVRIGTLEIEPAADDISDDRIGITLPASLRAGIQGVQVIHPRMMGTPETEHSGVVSNLAPFVLRPRIQRNAGDTAWEISVNVDSGSGSAPRAGEITVQIEPEVERDQRVVLLLNQTGAPSGQRPRAYTFDATSRLDETDETTDTVEFPFTGVAAGSYLVRVQVDGGESVLDPDGTGALAEPSLVVP